MARFPISGRDHRSKETASCASPQTLLSFNFLSLKKRSNTEHSRLGLARETRRVPTTLLGVAAAPSCPVLDNLRGFSQPRALGRPRFRCDTRL